MSLTHTVKHETVEEGCVLSPVAPLPRPSVALRPPAPRLLFSVTLDPTHAVREMCTCS